MRLPMNDTMYDTNDMYTVYTTHNDMSRIESSHKYGTAVPRGGGGRGY